MSCLTPLMRRSLRTVSCFPFPIISVTFLQATCRQLLYVDPITSFVLECSLLSCRQDEKRASAPQRRVRLQNVRKAHLEIILRFLYTNNIDVDSIQELPTSGTKVG